MICNILIIIFLSFGFLIGFKRGFIYQFVKSLGTIFIIILSFLLEKPVALFLAINFPITKITELNLFAYKSISFFLIFIILSFVLKIVLFLLRNILKVIKIIPFLDIPLKILGGLLSLIEYYIYVFIILLIINLPFFNINLNSSLASYIYTQTPLFSSYINTKSLVKIKDILESNSDNKTESIKRVIKNDKLINSSEIKQLKFMKS